MGVEFTHTKGGDMERRTLMVLAMTLALSMVAQAEDGTSQATEQKATPKWSEQSKSVQQIFEQQAPNWVKIGDKLWSVEVMKEAQKRAKRGKSDAFTDVSAPWFYEPISGTRCRWIGEVYKHMKLDAPEGYEVLEGVVSFNQRSEGFHVLPKKQGRNIFVYDDLNKPDIKSLVCVIGELQDQKFEYTAGGKRFSHQAYKQAKISVLATSISSTELFSYFTVHQIKQFPVWRARPNREHDGFDWKNYPRKINLPQ